MIGSEGRLGSNQSLRVFSPFQIWLIFIQVVRDIFFRSILLSGYLQSGYCWNRNRTCAVDFRVVQVWSPELFIPKIWTILNHKPVQRITLHVCHFHFCQLNTHLGCERQCTWNIIDTLRSSEIEMIGAVENKLWAEKEKIFDFLNRISKLALLMSAVVHVGIKIWSAPLKHVL